MVPPWPMFFHWAGLISMIKPQNIQKLDFSSLSHLANWQDVPLSHLANGQPALVKIYSIFERSLEILLEISRCLNHFPLLWIWMWDPFFWGSLLSSLTSPSYPFKPIKRASISLGRGSPFSIWNSYAFVRLELRLQNFIRSIVSHCWFVGKILSLHALETLWINLGAI